MSPTTGNPPVVGVNRLTTHQKTMWLSWCQTLGEGLENPVPLIQHIESDCYEVMQEVLQARHSHSVILFVKHKLQ